MIDVFCHYRKEQMSSFRNGGVPSFVRPHLAQTIMEPKLRQKSSIDSMFDQYSTRLSIGSVYDVQIKKDKDDTPVVRPATPDSSTSGSRRPSVDIELEGAVLSAVPLPSTTTLDISAPKLEPGNDENV
jgi:hypothetical protein